MDRFVLGEGEGVLSVELELVDLKRGQRRHCAAATEKRMVECSVGGMERDGGR